MKISLSLALLLHALPGRAADPGDTYQLAPMDKLTVSIEQDPVAGHPVEISVSSLYNLDVPVSRCCETVISLNVKGKTVRDVQGELKARLEEKYYKTASVQLRLVDRERAVRLGQVWLSGAVKGNIVQLEAGKRKTLWEALTQVGTSEFARLSKVRVDRVDPASGETKKIYVNIEAVQNGDRSKDLDLQDGDRVVVSEKFFNFR